jgi:thioredoxin 1
MLAPILDEISAEHPEIKVCKVNVDEEPDLAGQFQVMSIPALFVVKNGAVVNQTVGVQPKQKLLDLIG